MARYRFGSKVRDACWAGGVWRAYIDGRGRLPVCPHCGLEVSPDHPWDMCHVGAPRWAGGKNVLLPGHRACNQLHNNKIDTPAFAKSRRLRRGPRRSRNPFPCGKDSPWTKSVGGRVSLRVTASEKHRRALEARAIRPEEE
jgi:hypothetical protein